MTNTNNRQHILSMTTTMVTFLVAMATKSRSQDEIRLRGCAIFEPNTANTVSSSRHTQSLCVFPTGGGGGVHDLRMDGGLPPGFQKATLLLLPTVAVILTFMMNFGGKLPIFDNFCQGPLFREFWTQTPTHMGGTFPYPQHVMLPPPPRGRILLDI